MDDKLRTELERLKERQAQLNHAVDLLGVHISALEKRVAEGEAARAEQVLGHADRETGAPMAVPPVLETRNIQQPISNIEPPIALSAEPSTGNLQAATTAQVGKIGTQSRSETGAPMAVPPPLPPKVVIAGSREENIQHPTSNIQHPAGETRPESFEMRLGTYWLVRIGIVAMLTALVFFGAYAYQNFIPKIGAGGKVALLYLASGALLGFGAWFQRRAATEALRNYAQVLLAGGMAAVYFTTYAAHHFPNLQVITNATLDGALLLGWAGFMAWMADRKKSEVFALFAVGLAYYTSVMTQVGHFTLYSNLVLTAVVLFFLVRNRWAKLSFASLVATYASYGFWRFYSAEGWHWAGPDEGLWLGVYFLAAYWLVFTAAVFLSRHKEFAGVNRATFITLNNGAFYAMFLLTMFQVRSGGFWKFNLITGAVLLGAAALAKVRLRDEPLAANTYLTQGLLLVTVGIIAKFSGLQLALLLALESVVLWITGTMRRNIVMRTGACASAALAAVWAFGGIELDAVRGVWLGVGVGALLAFNGFWSHWKGQGKSPNLMRVSPTYFSVLALLIWSFAIWQNVALVNRPAAFALASLVLLASIYVTRLRELSLLAQALLPFGALLFLVNLVVIKQPEPWPVFACVMGVALALVHWWQRQTVVEVARELRVGGQFVMALIVAGITACWLEPKLDVSQWVLAMSALLVGLTIYGAATRNWVLALVGQGFASLAVGSFAIHAGANELNGLPALVPLAALTLLAFGGRRWAESQPAESKAARWVRTVALWYGRAAMALLLWWTFQYADSRELVWSFTALGAVAFVVAGWRRQRDFLVFSATLSVCALLSLGYHLLSGTAVYWLNFVAVLAWMAEQQIARRQVERYPVPAMAHNVAIVAAGVALWWLGSRWVMRDASGFYLTASWSVFAFAMFGVGVLLRERMYRWLGLGVLGAALARVVIFDVWKLDTLYRILSFFALGLVLLVLGFIYNKYQERIRQWL